MVSAAAAWARKLGFYCVFGTALAVASVGIQAKQPQGIALDSVVQLQALPSEGRVTHALILAGGPFPYEKDGTVFGNRERLLPKSKRGYYREYTVKTPGVRHRGARRMVCGGVRTMPDACYYSADHYASYRRIVD